MDNLVDSEAANAGPVAHVAANAVANAAGGVWQEAAELGQLGTHAVEGPGELIHLGVDVVHLAVEVGHRLLRARRRRRLRALRFCELT